MSMQLKFKDEYNSTTSYYGTVDKKYDFVTKVTYFSNKESYIINSIEWIEEPKYKIKISFLKIPSNKWQATVNHYRLKAVASITLAKRIDEMKSQNYLVCGAFLVLQYIFALVAHLDFPLLQQNNL